MSGTTYGLPPGSPVYTGDRQGEGIRLQRLTFGPDGADQQSPCDFPESIPSRGVVWIDLVGLHDVASVRRLAETFCLHPMAVEDVLNLETRPKHEDYGDYTLTVLKVVHPDRTLEQVCIVTGATWVLTFQEQVQDPFATVQQRIINGLGRVRREGTEYLRYALVDAVADGYLRASDSLQSTVEELEGDAEMARSSEVPSRIQDARVELLQIRRALVPMREVVAQLRNPDDQKTHAPYQRDLEDHVTRALEEIDALRDRLSNALQLFLAVSGHRTNDVMRVLTIVAVVFVPLTFIAGLYGMNFEHMPELGWRFGYPAVLVVMAITAVTLLFGFRRQGWL